MDEHREHDQKIAQQHLNPRFWRHAQFPVGAEPLDSVNGSATGVGSCGDKVTIQVTVVREHIQAIYQYPEGCVYTTACASAVSVLAKDRSLEKALEIQPQDVEDELGGLPEDHRHCARLAVNTLGEAIADYYQQTTHPAAGVRSKTRGNPHAHL